jgi:uncharacterized glyoxalase superfamily protein PhnB
MAKLQSAAPTFVVSDVGATARWYANTLGFEVYAIPETEPYSIANMVRDGVEIMLLGVEGYVKPDISYLRPGGMWDAYIRMHGVNELYDSLMDQPFVTMPMTRQAYGDKEFEIRDPNGYVLVFSELTD